MLFCIIPIAIVSSAIFIYAGIIDGTSSKGLTAELETTTATSYVAMRCGADCSEYDSTAQYHIDF